MKYLKKDSINETMKIFVIKTLFVIFCIFVLFKITIGSLVTKFNERIDFYTSKEQSIVIKEKLRKEMRSAIDKDQYLNADDAKLIRQFLDKIIKEINQEK
jgi:hypothetical protein|tara:strand:+ start:469 stop:768 length:300 start_codon:yes stop_codon:yes gene_type:complete